MVLVFLVEELMDIDLRLRLGDRVLIDEGFEFVEFEIVLEYV